MQILPEAIAILIANGRLWNENNGGKANIESANSEGELFIKRKCT